MTNYTDIFNKTYAFVLQAEGGYANDPDDKGGMTYKGITQSTYNTYLISKHLQTKAIATEYKVGSVPKGIKFVNYKCYKNKVLIKNVDVVIHITDEEIKEIYFNRYWLASGCNKMSDLFAVVSFDTAVNMGAGVVKATGMTRVQEFMKAAQYKDVDKFLDAREAKYREFAQYGEQSRFLNGWLQRTKRLRTFVKTIK